jgi:Fibronectin type III domain.
VRIMEAHEHYDRQHQDLRTEGQRSYGDVIDYVDFDYAARLTAVNLITLASLASAPPQPEQVEIGGTVQPAARLQWQPVTGAVGYKVYYRLTTKAQWSHYRWVDGGASNSVTMDGLVVDNYYFGVAAVNAQGYESLISWPSIIMRD